MTRRPLAHGPTIRTIKGRRVTVSFIVICDHCGNREVGWAWRDAQGWWRYDGEIEPPAHLGSEDDIRKTYGTDADAVMEGDWAKLKRQRGRLTGPVTERLFYRGVDDDGRLIAYCPHHGGVVTTEAVDSVPPSPGAATRRIRARRSAGE